MTNIFSSFLKYYPRSRPNDLALSLTQESIKYMESNYWLIPPSSKKKRVNFYDNTFHIKLFITFLHKSPTLVSPMRSRLNMLIWASEKFV